eukprot:s1418_g13.t2
MLRASRPLVHRMLYTCCWPPSWAPDADSSPKRNSSAATGDPSGYLPEAISVPVGVPCDIEDLTDVVRPQPLTGCATYLAMPTWVSYASLSAVCLDLRDLSPGGAGPLVAAFVTRPTCKEELCRQAGIFGARPCQVYVGTDHHPLSDDEAVQLANGCVVTFVQQDVRPCFANDLQFRLQFPEVWPSPPALPKYPALPALLLLHRRGRYLFRLEASNLPADEVAARFVGVDRGAVDIHVPADEGYTRLMHPGIGIRGVLAFIDRDTLLADSPQYVVFLDLRQVAHGIKFLVLARPYILRTELAGLVPVPRRPPPSWRLRVLGGRMRRDRLEFRPDEVLVFGFELTTTLTSLRIPFHPPRLLMPKTLKRKMLLMAAMEAYLLPRLPGYHALPQCARGRGWAWWSRSLFGSFLSM